MDPKLAQLLTYSFMGYGVVGPYKRLTTMIDAPPPIEYEDCAAHSTDCINKYKLCVHMINKVQSFDLSSDECKPLVDYLTINRGHINDHVIGEIETMLDLLLHFARTVRCYGIREDCVRFLNIVPFCCKFICKSADTTKILDAVRQNIKNTQHNESLPRLKNLAETLNTIVIGYRILTKLVSVSTKFLEKHKGDLIVASPTVHDYVVPKISDLQFTLEKYANNCNRLYGLLDNVSECIE